MDATSLLAYFAPLKTWLEAANSMSKECLGWEGYCEDEAAAYMEGEYENTTSKLYNKAALVEWDYQTDITDAHAEALVISYITIKIYCFIGAILLELFSIIDASQCRGG